MSVGVVAFDCYPICPQHVVGLQARFGSLVPFQLRIEPLLKIAAAAAVPIVAAVPVVWRPQPTYVQFAPGQLM